MKSFTFWRRLFNTPSPVARAAPPIPSVPAPAATTPTAPVTPHTDKLQRDERRNELGAALRETMLRSGILSSRYKARILNIGKHAEQFVILCELDDRDMNSDHETLQQLEKSLQQLLHERVSQIQSVQIYWRVHGQRDKVVPAPAMPPDFAPTQPMRHRE